MNNPFFVIYGALMAQPEMDPPQIGPSQTAQPGGGSREGSQELASYTLPSGQIQASDMPRVQSVMEEVLKKISTSRTTSGQGGSYLDLDTVKSSIFSFMDWLNGQGCVNKASTTYDIESTDGYDENIFAVYPGQLPFDIIFNMKGDVNPQYRLLIFVSRVDLLSFGNLMENTSLAGIPVPEPWPSGYLGLRP
jgi:hypothetical protein